MIINLNIKKLSNINLRLHINKGKMCPCVGVCSRDLKALSRVNKFQGSLYESFINIKW